jgi:hypothetical protein
VNSATSRQQVRDYARPQQLVRRLGVLPACHAIAAAASFWAGCRWSETTQSDFLVLGVHDRFLDSAFVDPGIEPAAQVARKVGTYVHRRDVDVPMTVTAIDQEPVLALESLRKRQGIPTARRLDSDH